MVPLNYFDYLTVRPSVRPLQLSAGASEWMSKLQWLTDSLKYLKAEETPNIIEMYQLNRIEYNYFHWCAAAAYLINNLKMCQINPTV